MVKGELKLITLENFSVRRGNAKIVKEISLDLDSGACLCVLGANGAGKSTFAEGLIGWLPIEGVASVDNYNLLHLSTRERARKIAFVPQMPPPALNVTAREYLSYSTYSNKLIDNFSIEDFEFQKAELLSFFGLIEIQDFKLMQLSVGQRQILSIIAAILQNSSVIILDEPFSALDLKTSSLVVSKLKEISIGSSKSVIVITHDLHRAVQLADKILAIRNGLNAFLGGMVDFLNSELFMGEYLPFLQDYEVSHYKQYYSSSFV